MVIKEAGFLTLKLPRYQRERAHRRAENLALLAALQTQRRHEETDHDQLTSDGRAEDDADSATDVEPESDQAGEREPNNPDNSATVIEGDTSSPMSAASSVVTDEAATIVRGCADDPGLHQVDDCEAVGQLAAASSGVNGS
jgi:hypothetical protein